MSYLVDVFMPFQPEFVISKSNVRSQGRHPSLFGWLAQYHLLDFIWSWIRWWLSNSIILIKLYLPCEYNLFFFCKIIWDKYLLSKVHVFDRADIERTLDGLQDQRDKGWYVSPTFRQVRDSEKTWSTDSLDIVIY